MAGITNTISLNDRMTPVLKSIIKALDSTLTAMASVDRISQREFGAATRAAQQARRAVEEFTTSLRNTSAPGTNAMNNVAGAARSASGTFDNLIQQAKMLLGTYLGFQGISKLVQGGDTFIGNVARLDLMNDGMRTTAELQQKIYEASQRSLANYNEMTAAVGKLGITAKHAFKNNDEIVAFTELLNKQFSIAGASQSEKAGAMYQLTQAMASGRLQGDEFRSILENAPMLAATIARSMNMSYKQMKEASTKGLITSDVIKKALFSVANETNTRFAEMPMKFGDLWMQVINKITKGLEPVYSQLSKMWNNKQFQAFIDGITNGLVDVLGLTIKVVEFMANAGSFISRNWNFVAPAIFFVAGALGALIAAHLIYNTVTGISSAVAAIHGASLMMQQGATFGATASQWGLNAALYACPLTWFVLGIIAIIAILYAVVAAINYFADTSLSATGVVVAMFFQVGAILHNVFFGILEIAWSVIRAIVNLLLDLGTFLIAVFEDPVGSIIQLFSSMAQAVIDIIGGIARAIDVVFGSNLADSVGSWKQTVIEGNDKLAEKYGNGGYAAIKAQREEFKLSDTGVMEGFGLNRIKYEDAALTGYNIGNNFQNRVKDNFKVGNKLFNMDDQFFKDMQADLAKTVDNTGATAGNTKKLADGINLSDEDVELLKESARVNFVNKMTSLTPKVTATFGDVRESADVNVILKLIEKLVKDASESDLT